jgi:hypothetical protein
MPVVLLCSCRSVTYDVRRNEEPIVLGHELAVTSDQAALEVTDVDDYHANVTSSEVTASASTGYATTTTTSQSLANDAQVQAFHKLV